MEKGTGKTQERKFGQSAPPGNKAPEKGWVEGGLRFCYLSGSESEACVTCKEPLSVDPIHPANCVVERVLGWRGALARRQVEGTQCTGDFTPLSRQLDGEGGENPASENGLLI